MEHYKIEGSGTTVITADKALRDEFDGLVKKLEKANASTEIKVEKSIFRVTYTLKPEIQEKSANVTLLRLESPESWEALLAKAGRSVEEINLYNPSFTVEQYLKLTKEQKEALESKRRNPPAGYDDRSSRSSLFPRL